MTQKKTTFKQRIRKNDMRQRHEIGTGLRKRMGAARRIYNRFDSVDNGARPMEMIMSEIAEGTAVPSQEVALDPRSLTDLLLRPAKDFMDDSNLPTHANVANTSSGGGAPKSNGNIHVPSKKKSGKPHALLASAPLAAEKVLPSQPLAVDDPLALPDTRIFEEEERQERLAREAAAQQNENKNLYRHSGQSYLFWERIALHPVLLQALRKLHFTHPTPVQEEVLPNVLAQGNKDLARQLSSQESKKSKKHKRSSAAGAAGAAGSAGQDVVVSAETGSGKTLVFALPILQHLLTTLDKEGVKAPTPAPSTETPEKTTTPVTLDANLARAERKLARQRRIMHSLIISPTRELALQIYSAFRQLTEFAPHVVVGCVVGGMAQERQQRVLNRHPHILICTPGRLWDLVQKNEGCYLGHSISRRLHYVVLDEADKMLQSGRFDELRTLLERIHCEVLPAGFVQEREEGAEAGEISVESGRWDPDTKTFIPFGKEEVNAAKRTGVTGDMDEDAAEATESAVKTKKGKKRARAAKEATEEAPTPTAQMKKKKADDGDMSSTKKHKASKKYAKQVARAVEEEDEGARDEEEVTSETQNICDAHRKKDEPQPTPMPPEPAAEHRVITYVTSATLSLQTNYERRDFSARKSIIRTSNADVLNKVLQQLEIKPSNALVFSLAESATVAARINETYLRCPENSKDLYLYYFLKTYHDDRAIIFVNAISMLRRLVNLLEVLGIAVVGLHASMQQRQRLKFIDKFKRGDIRVLVATDVASRGLDIDGLKYVVHYQVPRTTDAYIHRCGRTARCGGTGLSLLLVNAQEHMSFRKLMESLGRKESEVETFALQATVVHQLHSHLRIAWQIDKLQKEIRKSCAKNQWVHRMTKEADLETDDMYDDTADAENREKKKALRILQRELELLGKKFTGQFGGKGAFRTSAYALGAKQAEQRLKERADRQAICASNKKKNLAKGGGK